MEKLTNKIKTCYGWDVYELTEEENRSLRPRCERTDTKIRGFWPKKTFFVFKEGENFDTTIPKFVCRTLEEATHGCRVFPRRTAENKHLNVEWLKSLREGEWVWIEVLKPFDFTEKVSAYYRKQADYTRGRAFVCGYPGLSFTFDYADYNDTWTAYLYQPTA